VALSSRVCESPDELGACREEWDALAVASGQPFAAPAWVLAWWRNLRPERARLRLVLVREKSRLVGLVPLFAIGRSHYTLGGGLAPVEPLSRPGLAQEVARAAAGALAERRPTMIELEAHGSSPSWAALLGEAWPGRGARCWLRSEAVVPRVDLGDGFDDWMSSRSASFRREIRRKQRKLREAGGAFRFATAQSIERDVSTFLRLHRRRLTATSGETSLGDEGIERFLVDAGEDLLDSGRFRLLCLDLEGKTIATQLLLVAGREVSAWNSGFDEAFAQHSPSIQCIVEGLRDAADRGGRTMSLGQGAHDYKFRFADQRDRLETYVLAPRDLAYPLTRMRLAPAQLRYQLSRRISPRLKRRLRR
jgi:CelD/BcsL family acetyltransferase involved in cellulose biosynthesis